MSTQTGARGGQDGAKQTWRGFITDTHCGMNCQVTKDMTPDKECVRLCVRKGSKYGLWVAHHVYELEPQDKAARFAAADYLLAYVPRGNDRNSGYHVVEVKTTREGLHVKTRQGYYTSAVSASP
jgi:hypothetical protein